MKCCVIHFYYLHTILYTLATPLWPPAPLRQLGVEVRLLKGSDSGGSGTSWSEASSPLCYHQPHIKWQKTCEGWKENQILTTARRRIQRICRVGVSIHSRRLALEEGDVALGEMTAVIWISIAAAHVATRCLVEQQKYSTRWHTHLLPSTQGPERKKKKKSWAQSSEQQLQGRKWGQGIWRRSLLFPFNQTAFSLPFYFFLFFFRFKYLIAKILCLPPVSFSLSLGCLRPFSFPFSSACEGESFLTSSPSSSRGCTLPTASELTCDVFSSCFHLPDSFCSPRRFEL